MNKKISILLTIALLIGIVVLSRSIGSSGVNSLQAVQNTEIRDGVQYVTITAQGGYFPNTTTAKANIPTKLIVQTNGTYDCSTALVIRSINFQKMLPPTGEEVIDLGSPEVGSMQGLCSMGMYSFVVNFI